MGLRKLIILSNFSTKKLLKSFSRVVDDGSGSGSFLLRRVLNILKRALGS